MISLDTHNLFTYFSAFVWWCYSLWWIWDWSCMEKFGGFCAPWEMISSVSHLPQWVLEQNSHPEQMLLTPFCILSKRSFPPLPQSPDFNYRDECPLSHGIMLVQGVQPWTGSVPAPCPLDKGRDGQTVYSASHHVRLWGHHLSIPRQLRPDYRLEVKAMLQSQLQPAQLTTKLPGGLTWRVIVNGVCTFFSHM